MFKGFRWFNNTLFLLLFFVIVGLTIHYRGHTKPIVAFWNDVKSVLFPRDEPSKINPYKAPEPDDVASDNRAATDDKTTLLEKEGIDESTVNSETPPSPESKSERRPTQRPESKAERRPVQRPTSNIELPAIGSNDQIVRHSRYTLRYREQYEQADWVAYNLTEEEASTRLSREGDKFVPDPLIKTGSATTQDYVRSGYDRGHLCPAGDFNSSNELKQETFYMSNISPQIPQFNRGIWSNLEQKFRDWALRDGQLYVVTGPVLKPGLPTIGRYNEIAVPEQYYKIALYMNGNEARMIGFLLKNEFSNENLKTFVVSVDDIEALTGIDFFNRLPDALEKRLESSTSIQGWFASRY